MEDGVVHELILIEVEIHEQLPDRLHQLLHNLHLILSSFFLLLE